ncbi:unnamed protein product [Coccothraustes coccothraustes]
MERRGRRSAADRGATLPGGEEPAGQAPAPQRSPFPWAGDRHGSHAIRDPSASSTGLSAACGTTAAAARAIAVLSGGPRRETGRAGRAPPAPPRGAVPVSPGRRRSWEHTAWGSRRGSPAPVAASRAADPARGHAPELR